MARHAVGSAQRTWRAGERLGALKAFLALQAALTGATAATLLAAPGVIPAQFGIALPPGGYPVLYLLASAELTFALLSAWALSMGTAQSVLFVAGASALYQGLFGLAGLFAVLKGGAWGVMPNVLAHVAIALIFSPLIVRARRAG